MYLVLHKYIFHFKNIVNNLLYFFCFELNIPTLKFKNYIPNYFMLISFLKLTIQLCSALKTL